MKKVLSLLTIAALVVGMTQCKKDVVGPAAECGDMITMTVSAGIYNEKTDINSNGVVTWNLGDQIYYGQNAENVQVTTVTELHPDLNGVANKIATFTITVESGKQYHFYYCGSNVATTTDGQIIDFSTQRTPDGQTDLEYIASTYHVNYGTATITDPTTTTIGMTNIMSVGFFNFDSEIEDVNFIEGEDIVMKGLPSALQLTFDENVFKVGSVENSVFNAGSFGKITVKGAGKNNGKYVAIAPENNGENSSSLILSFTGATSNAKRSVTMANGVVKNKFYVGQNINTPITLTKSKHVFSISEAEAVYFAPGNLYYNGSSWNFENNQYDWRTYYAGKNSNNETFKPAVIDGVYDANGTPDNHWGLFRFSTTAAHNNWGMHTKKVATTGYTNGDFKDWGMNSISYSGSQGTFVSDGWFTLSMMQWSYVLGLRDNCAAKCGEATITLANGTEVYGMVLLPDDWEKPSSCDFTTNAVISKDIDGELRYISNVNYTDNNYSVGANSVNNRWEDMEAAGAVFFPISGYRNGDVIYSNNTYYHSCSCNSDNSKELLIANGGVANTSGILGISVRLVHH